MKKIKVFCSILLVCLSFPIIAQEDNSEEMPSPFWLNHKEIGFNFSPLISTLIPFNLGDTNAGFTSFSYKRYKKKFALRINAGLKLDDRNEDGDNFVLLTLGFEKRRMITKKVSLVTGMDFGLFGLIDEEPFFNISTFYGFEYNFNDKFFIATEGNFQFLVGEGINVNVNPPVAVFFYVRI